MPSRVVPHHTESHNRKRQQHLRSKVKNVYWSNDWCIMIMHLSCLYLRALIFRILKTKRKFTRYFESAKEKWFSQTIHTYKPYWLTWMVIVTKHISVERHDILMLGKSPIKWKQRLDKTIAVDWDVKHQFKQTNNTRYFKISPLLLHATFRDI